MTDPRVLLLDEVSLGLAPAAVEAVYASLSGLLGAGATVVLVEQDLSRAMRVADRLVCCWRLTTDGEPGLELAERLETGIVHVNDQPIRDEPQMPFGGVKNSGCGRFGAEESTELRWTTVQNRRRALPFGVLPTGEDGQGVPAGAASRGLRATAGRGEKGLEEKNGPRYLAEP